MNLGAMNLGAMNLGATRCDFRLPYAHAGGGQFVI